MKKLNLGQAVTCAVDKYLDDDLSKIIKIYENLDSVTNVSDNLPEIKAVNDELELIKDLSNVIQDVVAMKDTLEHIEQDRHDIINVSNNMADIKKVNLNEVNINRVANEIDAITTIAGLDKDFPKFMQNIDDIKVVAQESDAIKDLHGVQDVLTAFKGKTDTIVQLPDRLKHVDQVKTSVDTSEKTVKGYETTVETLKQSVDKSKAEVDKSKDIAVTAGIEAQAYSLLAKNSADKAASLLSQVYIAGGLHTPKPGSEYPDISKLQNKDVLFIVNIDPDREYTFSGGTLAGLSTHSGDQLLYMNNAKEWHLIKLPSVELVIQNYIHRLYPVGSVVLLFGNEDPNKLGYPGVWIAVESDFTLMSAKQGPFTAPELKNRGMNHVECKLPSHTHTGWVEVLRGGSAHTHDVGNYRIQGTTTIYGGSDVSGPFTGFTGALTSSGRGTSDARCRAVDHEIRGCKGYNGLAINANRSSGFIGSSGAVGSEHTHETSLTIDRQGVADTHIDVRGQYLEVVMWYRSA